MITFDDGYQSFADLAWPILRGYNFIPEVFVVTDLIGEFARWDDYPDVSPLMSLNVIKELSIEGVEFGSHMATHRAIDGLSTRDLLTELARSSSIISSITGAIPRGLALPYSIPDHRLPVLAQQAGYQVVFGSRTGVAHVLDDPFDLARIEIKGDTTLDEFIRTMEVYL
jgi:peptidoglycan/xylan/chitin deacetylase (PgdA/CDA1 family)